MHHQSFIQYRTSGEYLSAVPVYRRRIHHRTQLSVLYGIKGGKGIAATAGLILSFHPYFIVMGVVLFFGAFLTTHYVSLGSLLVYAGFMIQMVVCGQMGLFGAMPQSQLMKCMQLLYFLRLWHIGSTDRILSA